MQTREEIIDVDSFVRRHIGPNEEEVRAMLGEVGFENLNALIDAAVPKNIRLNRQLNLPEAKSETEALAELRAIANKNKIVRSFIGAGYHGCTDRGRHRKRLTAGRSDSRRRSDVTLSCGRSKSENVLRRR